MNINVRIEQFVKEIKESYPKLAVRCTYFNKFGHYEIWHNSEKLEYRDPEFKGFAAILFEKYFDDVYNVVFNYESGLTLFDPYAPESLTQWEKPLYTAKELIQSIKLISVVERPENWMSSNNGELPNWDKTSYTANFKTHHAESHCGTENGKYGRWVA